MPRLGPLGRLIFIGLVLLSLAAGCWLRAIDAPEWWQPQGTGPLAASRPWAIEADCYSQLARVQRILQGGDLIQNHFTVENWPEGMIPSTTAPFDYAILLLYLPLTLVTKYPLDWAGALISPLLWVALVLFWTLYRGRGFNLAGRALLIFGSAVMPALIFATVCGRPRHQSLILALMALGLTAEFERWDGEGKEKSRRAWNILAGITWGLACWTSLFEPALVVTTLVVFNLIARRCESARFGISFGLVMLLALVLEGVHVFIPPPEYREALARWLATIAEVRGTSLSDLAQEMAGVNQVQNLGWSLLLLFPYLLWLFLPWLAWDRWTKGEKADRLIVLLMVLLGVLTFFQRRWLYYSNLAELILIARYVQVAPRHGWRLALVAVFVVAAAVSNYQQIANVGQAPSNQPSPQLAQVARAIDAPGGIMAPWWISPGLLYFSGQPIVSGSSHCGISGIVASAQFFSATSWIDAERILQQRRVRWIVVYDEDRYFYPLLNSSQGILGEPFYRADDARAADATIAQILVNDRLVPMMFQLRAVTPNLKLYKYTPATGP